MTDTADTGAGRPHLRLAASGDDDELPEGFSGVVHVFEAHASSSIPLRDYLQNLWDRRAFLVEMAKAELRGPRSNTVLGRVWGVMDPMFSAAIYFFVFVVIRNGRGRPLEFLPVLLADIFLFNLTTTAMSEGGRSITSGRTLLLNSVFPRALLPLVAVYKSLLSFLPSLGVVVLVMALLRSPVGAGIFVLPLLFVIQIAMNVGIALLVSTLIVFVRDASNLLTYIVRVAFFITPIIYPASSLPGSARALIFWQPFYGLFESYQRVFSGGTPRPGMVLLAIVWAGVLLVGGLRIFRRHERDFANYL